MRSTCSKSFLKRSNRHEKGAPCRSKVRLNQRAHSRAAGQKASLLTSPTIAPANISSDRALAIVDVGCGCFLGRLGADLEVDRRRAFARPKPSFVNYRTGACNC